METWNINFNSAWFSCFSLQNKLFYLQVKLFHLSKKITGASLVAQLVMNPSAMQETWVQSLGWEDPLEEGKATHSNIPAWRIPMDREAWQATVHGVAKNQTQQQLSTARGKQSNASHYRSIRNLCFQFQYHKTCAQGD